MHPISPFRRNHKQMQTLAVQFASDAGEENQSSWAMPIRHVSAGGRSRLCLSDKRNHKANCFAALPRRIVTPWPGFMTKPPGSFSRPPCARPRLFPPHHRRRNLLAHPTTTAPLIPINPSSASPCLRGESPASLSGESPEAITDAQPLINTPLQRGEPAQLTAALTASAVFPGPHNSASHQSEISNLKFEIPSCFPFLLPYEGNASSTIPTKNVRSCHLMSLPVLPCHIHFPSVRILQKPGVQLCHEETSPIAPK